MKSGLISIHGEITGGLSAAKASDVSWTFSGGTPVSRLPLKDMYGGRFCVTYVVMLALAAH